MITDINITQKHDIPTTCPFFTITLFCSMDCQELFTVIHVLNACDFRKPIYNMWSHFILFLNYEGGHHHMIHWNFASCNLKYYLFSIVFVLSAIKLWSNHIWLKENLIDIISFLSLTIFEMQMVRFFIYWMWQIVISELYLKWVYQNTQIKHRMMLYMLPSEGTYASEIMNYLDLFILWIHVKLVFFCYLIYVSFVVCGCWQGDSDIKWLIFLLMVNSKRSLWTKMCDYYIIYSYMEVI